MGKSTLLENLINAPKETRDDTINNFAALMGVDVQTVHSLLTLYHAARINEADEIILGLTFGYFCAADAVRVLDAAGIRSVLVDGDSTAALKIVHAFLSAGWRASATVIGYDDGDRPALRLSRA